MNNARIRNRRGAGILLMLLAPVFCTGCRLPGGESDWTVMSWNVQNRFDGIDDGTEYPEFDPGTGKWDDRLYRRRLERAGEVIREAVPGGADLIVLQELEKPEILDRLAEGPLKGLGYHWRIGIPGYSIIRCGILSRYPVSRVKVLDCGRWGERPLRPAVSFDVETPGGGVRVVAVHWKSPRDGRAATEATRIREAERALLLAMNGTTWPALPVMILGDLNTPGDGSLRPAALAPWEPGAVPGGAVILRSPVPEGTGIKDGMAVYFDPEPDEGPPGTYWYGDSWTRPDRALLSPAFLGASDIDFTACRSGGVPAMEDSLGRPVPWRTHLEEGYSDHLPLLLEFRCCPDEGAEPSGAG